MAWERWACNYKGSQGLQQCHSPQQPLIPWCWPESRLRGTCLKQASTSHSWTQATLCSCACSSLPPSLRGHLCSPAPDSVTLKSRIRRLSVCGPSIPIKSMANQGPETWPSLLILCVIFRFIVLLDFFLPSGIYWTHTHTHTHALYQLSQKHIK